MAWGLFGFGAALLWQMTGSDPWGQGIVWILALLSALGLLLWLEA